MDNRGKREGNKEVGGEKERKDAGEGRETFVIEKECINEKDEGIGERLEVGVKK